MSNNHQSGCRYERQKANIRSRLEAYEGEGPPSVLQLWHSAEYDASGCGGWIEDMPPIKEAIEAAKGDILKALVALEMAEERLEDSENGELDHG